MYDEVIGDDELVDALAGEDDVELVGDDDDIGDDPDVEALLAGDDVFGAAPNTSAALANLNRQASMIAAAGRGLPAPLRRRLRRALRKSRAAASIAARQAIAVRKRPLQNAGEVPMGFSQVVAAGADAIVLIQPPVAFNPKRLLIPDSIAASFDLRDLSCGMRRLMVTTNPVPCESFSQVSLNQGWRIPTIQVGQTLSMTFRNVSGADATIRGAWLGVYAD